MSSLLNTAWTIPIEHMLIWVQHRPRDFLSLIGAALFDGFHENVRRNFFVRIRSLGKKYVSGNSPYIMDHGILYKQIRKGRSNTLSQPRSQPCFHILDTRCHQDEVDPR